VLAYICIDFGFLNKGRRDIAGQRADVRAGTEIGLAATFVVFLFTYLNLNRCTAISAMARWCGSPAGAVSASRCSIRR